MQTIKPKVVKVAEPTRERRLFAMRTRCLHCNRKIPKALIGRLLDCCCMDCAMEVKFQEG